MFFQKINEISVLELSEKLDQFELIDVRTEEEFHGELSHIQNSKLVPMGEDLDTYLEEMKLTSEIVFICRSGRRSADATLRAQKKGAKKVFNLVGGMIAWNNAGLKTQANT